jgi:DNA polymerase-3 subunit delta
VPVHVLHGPDELSLQHRLQELKDQADGGSGMLTTNLTTIDGRDARPADIISPAMVAPFLAPMRMVLVDGLLDRFQSRQLGQFEELLSAIEAGIPETTLLVLTGGGRDEHGHAPRGKNQLLERLKKLPGAKVEQFAEVRGQAFERYVRDQASARGLRLRPGRSTRKLDAGEEWRRPQEPDPVKLLASLFPGDTLGLASELDKLALYSMGREITIDDIDLVCGGDRAATVFDFTDAVQDGDLARARDALAYLVLNGESEQGILAILMGAYRRSAIVLDLLAEGASPEEIGKKINQAYPNLRDRAIARARRLGHEGLRRAYEAMVDADRTHKLGQVDDDLALEILVARLCELSPSRR